MRKKKAALAETITALPEGTVVLVEDETILREFPPLRAAWAKRGAPAEVAVLGTNAKRVVFGTLNPTTGTRLTAVGDRQSGPAFRAFLHQLRATYKRPDIFLLLDRGSCHTAQATQALAAELRITFGWLPVACPHDNPQESLWRHGKQHVSANRVYANIDEHALFFIEHLHTLSPADAKRIAGVHSPNFWIPT